MVKGPPEVLSFRLPQALARLKKAGYEPVCLFTCPPYQVHGKFALGEEKRVIRQRFLPHDRVELLVAPDIKPVDPLQN